ncbi:MAG: hypothetical protein P4M02_08180 [Clostridia bacterium]|nr:hypothetical protein [Clostridia bacterium]
MNRKSVLISRKNTTARHETGFLMCAGLATLACGLALVFIPSFADRALAILNVSWLLLLCMILAFIRLLLYNRGFADTIMGAFTVIFYGVLGWAMTPADVTSITGYRPVICVILLFLGLSRVPAFAQLLNHVMLPVLLMSAALEIAAGILLFFGLPDYNAFYLYFLPGLAIVLSGLGIFSEASRARIAGAPLHSPDLR